MTTTSTRQSFRKGELATYVSNWDGKGTFYWRQVLVTACGVKQMTLVDAVTEKCLGRNFRPVVAEEGAGTYKLLDDDAAYSVTFAAAVDYLRAEDARCRRNLLSDSFDVRTIAHQRLAELHEPKADCRTAESYMG